MLLACFAPKAPDWRGAARANFVTDQAGLEFAQLFVVGHRCFSEEAVNGIVPGRVAKGSPQICPEFRNECFAQGL